MMAEQALAPDPAEIEQHLTHITRRWSELDVACVLETRMLTNEDRAQVKDVARFTPTPQGIADAAQHVAEMNKHKLNGYVVVNPIRAAAELQRGRAAKDDDIAASFFHWGDADDQKAADNIKSFVGPRPTLVVMTGTKPSLRPHVYWELDEPTLNMPAWRATQEAIAATLKTDATVVNPSRIMRIGGTINWPKPQKSAKGYIVEKTQIHIHSPDDRPPVTSERMARAFAGATVAPRADGISINTNEAQPPLDRERTIIKALSGDEWNIAVFKLIGSYVRKGLSDSEIHALTDPLTLGGYTVADTRAEVQAIIDRTRANPGFDGAGATYAEPNFTAPEGEAQAPKPAPALEWFEDIEASLGSDYLVKSVLDVGTMSVVYGPSNSGKTFFALDLAYHIAIGAEWRGHRVKQSCVLYLAAEGGRGVLNRVVALKLVHGIVTAPLAVKRAGLDLLHADADLQAVYDLATAVKQAAQDMPLLIVIDTLSRVMAGGDENSAADMTALIRNIDAIREATGAHIMLVHHTGKDTARGARGHSSLRAATDTEIEVQNEDGNRAAQVQKQRDHQGGETFAFALKGVSIGTDPDGDEVTSCVVEVTDSEEFKAVRKAQKGRGKNQTIIMETFDQMIADGLGRPNPGGVGMPERGQFWSVDANELRTISQGKMVGDNAARLFRQAWDALTDKNGIFVVGDKLTWRIDRRKR